MEDVFGSRFLNAKTGALIGLGSVAIGSAIRISQNPEYLQTPPEELALKVAYAAAFYTGAMSLTFGVVGYVDRRVISPALEHVFGYVDNKLKRLFEE